MSLTKMLQAVHLIISVKNPNGVVRHGLKKCGECRKQFTVKVGTVFEHARMSLTKMLQAVHLIISVKNPNGVVRYYTQQTLPTT